MLSAKVTLLRSVSSLLHAIADTGLHSIASLLLLVLQLVLLLLVLGQTGIAHLQAAHDLAHDSDLHVHARHQCAEVRSELVVRGGRDGALVVLVGVFLREDVLLAEGDDGCLVLLFLSQRLLEAVHLSGLRSKLVLEVVDFASLSRVLVLEALDLGLLGCVVVLEVGDSRGVSGAFGLEVTDAGGLLFAVRPEVVNFGGLHGVLVSETDHFVELLQTLVLKLLDLGLLDIHAIADELGSLLAGVGDVVDVVMYSGGP